MRAAETSDGLHSGYGARAGPSRLPAIIGTLGLHLALLLLLLWLGNVAPPIKLSSEALLTFDVLPEPPPLPPPPPPPEPEPEPEPVARTRPDPKPPRESGAPQPSRAPIAAMSSIDLPQIADITIAPNEPLAAPAGTGDYLTAGAGLVPASERGADDSGAGKGAGAGGGAGGGATNGGPLRRAQWIYRPPPREVRRYWPPEAKAKRVTGRVILACVVPRQGRPTGCEVHSEKPEGLGFGAAALQLWPQFVIRPVTRDKSIMDLPIFVPVTFDYSGR